MMARDPQIGVRLPHDLLAKLKTQAALARTTPAALARELIRWGLKHDAEDRPRGDSLSTEQIERLFAAAITAEQALLALLMKKSPDLRRTVLERAREEAAALVGRRTPKRPPAPSPATREQKKTPRTQPGASTQSAATTPAQRKQDAAARRQQALRDLVGAENISIPEG